MIIYHQAGDDYRVAFPLSCPKKSAGRAYAHCSLPWTPLIAARKPGMRFSYSPVGSIVKKSRMSILMRVCGGSLVQSPLGLLI